MSSSPQSSQESHPAQGLPAEMPDAWIDQIKRIVKPNWWTVILASSVLAAGISSALSYVIAVRNIEANKQLEISKSRLELQRDLVRSRVTAYQGLSDNLNVLVIKLEGFCDIVSIADRYPPSAETNNRIQEQLKTAGLALRDVIGAKSKSPLDGSDRVKEVDNCLQKLGPALADARDNPRATLPRIKAAIECLRTSALNIQGQIPKELDTIH
jgi:hypothetical protein